MTHEETYASLPKVSMKWDFDSEGAWTAKSVAHDMNLPFEWKIVVLEDGKFSFEESERELVTGLHYIHFDTFAQCKEFCEIEEAFLWKEVYFEYEDRLDEKLPGYPYEAMYRHSRVIDGVRMFPSLKYK